MKQLIIAIIALFIGLIVVPTTRAVSAASLSFDKTTASVNVGDSISIKVLIDAGTEQIISSDAYVLFDGTALQAQSVSDGDFFPIVSSNINTSRVYIAGLVTDVASAKTGSGTLATISFKGLKNATVTLSFDCQGVGGPSKIIKNEVNSSNIIVCSSNGTSIITVGSGSSGSSSSGSTSSNPTTTATPSVLPQTGIMDYINLWSTVGIVLFIIGGTMRLLLL
jgi:hypothetical protein